MTKRTGSQINLKVWGRALLFCFALIAITCWGHGLYSLLASYNDLIRSRAKLISRFAELNQPIGQLDESDFEMSARDSWFRTNHYFGESYIETTHQRSKAARHQVQDVAYWSGRQSQAQVWMHQVGIALPIHLWSGLKLTLPEERYADKLSDIDKQEMIQQVSRQRELEYLDWRAGVSGLDFSSWDELSLKRMIFNLDQQQLYLSKVVNSDDVNVEAGVVQEEVILPKVPTLIMQQGWVEFGPFITGVSFSGSSHSVHFRRGQQYTPDEWWMYMRISPETEELHILGLPMYHSIFLMISDRKEGRQKPLKVYVGGQYLRSDQRVAIRHEQFEVYQADSKDLVQSGQKLWLNQWTGHGYLFLGERPDEFTPPVMEGVIQEYWLDLPMSMESGM